MRLCRPDRAARSRRWWAAGKRALCGCVSGVGPGERRALEAAHWTRLTRRDAQRHGGGEVGTSGQPARHGGGRRWAAVGGGGWRCQVVDECGFAWAVAMPCPSDAIARTCLVREPSPGPPGRRPTVLSSTAICSCPLLIQRNPHAPLQRPSSSTFRPRYASPSTRQLGGLGGLRKAPWLSFTKQSLTPHAAPAPV